MSLPETAAIPSKDLNRDHLAATPAAPVTALTFHAVVDDLREQQRLPGRVLWQMALSHTTFTPGDTGTLVAVSRKGTRLEIPVLRVEHDLAGRLWHIVEKPLAAGTDVTGEVTAPLQRGEMP